MFPGYLTTLSVSSRKMDWWTEKDLQGSGRGLVTVLSQHMTRVSEENHKEPQDSRSSNIGTEHTQDKVQSVTSRPASSGALWWPTYEIETDLAINTWRAR
jgi:hypothetical protein